MNYLHCFLLHWAKVEFNWDKCMTAASEKKNKLSNINALKKMFLVSVYLQEYMFHHLLVSGVLYTVSTTEHAMWLCTGWSQRKPGVSWPASGKRCLLKRLRNRMRFVSRAGYEATELELGQVMLGCQVIRSKATRLGRKFSPGCMSVMHYWTYSKHYGRSLTK